MRNRKTQLGLMLLFVPLISLGGCTFITKQIDRPTRMSENALKQKPTHYFTILDELGPPAYVTALPEGFAFQYEALKINEDQFGISTDAAFLRWFKLAYGSASATREVQVYVFDKEGNLQSYAEKRIKDKAGKGMSFQFIATVTPIVDTAYLEKPVTQHAWGASLMKPLPIALNRAQSMDSGQGGLEQRGTPTSVGQRALEMRNVPKKSRKRAD